MEQRNYLSGKGWSPLLLLVAIMSGTTTLVANAQSDPKQHETALLAHRGLVRHAPENTLPAFAAAVELGLSIELDVYQTSDKQLVVIHDKTVDRTTNGTGEVTQMTLADIRKLDAGSWFHPCYAGLKVPTLDEAFQLIRQRQRKPVTIALNMKVISPGIEANIVKFVAKHKLFDQLFAFGQPEDSSRKFKQANPKLRTTEVKVYDSKHFARALKNPLADCLWVGFIPSRDEMDEAHKLGKQVWLSLHIGARRPDIWDKARASRMDGICTDWPLECRLHWRNTKASSSAAKNNSPAINDIKQARLCVTGADHNRPDNYPGLGDFIGWPGGIERMPNGDLLLVHSSGYWHSSFAQPRQIEPGLRKRWLAQGWPLDFPAPTGGRVMGCRSTDNGKTWSKPFTISDHRLDDGGHAVITCRDGTVLCFVGVQASWYGYAKAPEAFRKDIDGLNTKQFVLRSTDSGKTWSKPIGLDSPGDFYERAHGGRPIQLADGGILWATYYQVAGEKYLRGAIRRSDDSGKTWKVISKIIRPDNNIDEPVIAELKDGRLILITRPDGAVYHSKDKGVTWTDSGKTVVPPGSSKLKAPQLIVLRDGTVVAVATWKNLRVWISTDGGMTWSKDIPLDISSYGYPGSYIVSDDESILLPYCASGRAPNRVYLVRFRVNSARNGIELLPVPTAVEQSQKVNSRTPKVLWTVDTKSDSKGSAAVADINGDSQLEIVFGTYFNDRHLYAVSGTDGRVEWKFESDRGPLDASVAIADVDDDGKPEVLAADSSSGNLFCVNGKGEEEWRLKLPNSTDSPPSIADINGDGNLDIAAGSMWMGDGKGHLNVYQASDRKMLWQKKVPGCVQSAACLVDVNGDKALDAIVTSWRGDRGVHAFSGTDGKLLWHFQTAGTDKSMGMYHGPSVSGSGKDRRLLVATCDGDVYALNNTGKQLWHRHFDGEYLFAPTTVADINGDKKDEVLVGGRSHLYVLRVSDGELLWKYKVASFIGRGAAVADVTGNGNLDIIFCEGTRLHVLSGKGKPLFSFEAAPDKKQDYRVRISSAPVVGDFDADGSLDVFFVVGRGNYSRDKTILGKNWGRGYALRLGGNGPGWSTFRGNLHRSGHAQRLAN